MTNPILDLLTATQNLIRDPKDWTTGAFARDEFRSAVNPTGPEATCWCTVGAVRKILNPKTSDLHDRRSLYHQILTRLGNIVGGEVVHFNDTHTHAEVMAIFDKARHPDD